MTESLRACDLPSREPTLAKIRRLTPILEKAFDFSELFLESGADIGYRELESMGNGQIMFKSLMWTEPIAVCDNIAAAGSRYLRHGHSGIEIFITYKGQLDLTFNGNIKKLREGSWYYINSSVPHFGECEVNTKFIAITMPGDKAWRPIGQ